MYLLRYFSFLNVYTMHIVTGNWFNRNPVKPLFLPLTQTHTHTHHLIYANTVRQTTIRLRELKNKGPLCHFPLFTKYQFSHYFNVWWYVIVQAQYGLGFSCCQQISTQSTHFIFCCASIMNQFFSRSSLFREIWSWFFASALLKWVRMLPCIAMRS